MNDVNIGSVMVSNESFFAEVDSVLQSGLSVIILVKGCSMFPMIEGGKDKVKVVPYIGTTPQLGDVCLFRYNQFYVLHRFTRILSNGRYEMLGDGNILPEVVSSDTVCGHIVAIHKSSGKEISLSSFRWQLFSMFWMKSRFARRYLLCLIRVWKRIISIPRESLR